MYYDVARKVPRLGIPGYTVVKKHTRSRPGEGPNYQGPRKNLKRRPRKKRGQVSYKGTGGL